MSPRAAADSNQPWHGAADGSLESGSGIAVRRAPFSENPQLGARGQRTRQRILDATLRVFGEEGYHQCSIDRIAKEAGCSRVSFYQYFAGKEDVFRDLTGQVARQLRASTEALDQLTPDREGWETLQAWIGRYADIHERYQPVFAAFDMASESDAAVASGSARWNARQIARFRSSLVSSDLPPRELDPLITLLLECLSHALGISAILRSAVPSAYRRARIEAALTDTIHRALFGIRANVNVRPAAHKPPPVLEFGPAMREMFEQEEVVSGAATEGRPALAALVRSGREVFVRRGYHRTRVDDLVTAAGVSHGAFYRYFDSKDQLARVLTAQALQTVSTAFSAIPTHAVHEGSAPHAALRRWLRHYGATQADEAAMIRVWSDAALHDAKLKADMAPAYDWGRRRMVQFLVPRGFGDVEVDAVVMVALMSAFGASQRPPAAIDATCHIIERGLLGR